MIKIIDLLEWLQSLEEELNKRQNDIRNLTETAGKLQEQQVHRSLIIPTNRYN